jgi:hypothetical protein
MADRETMIRFGDGSQLELKPSPDEIANEIEKAEGRLIRVLDSDHYPVWFNPAYIVSVTSHDIKKRADKASGL